jgi:hypothetical protein
LVISATKQQKNYFKTNEKHEHAGGRVRCEEKGGEMAETLHSCLNKRKKKKTYEHIFAYTSDRSSEASCSHYPSGY